MSVYQPFYQHLDAMGLASWRQILAQQVEEKLAVDRHGKMPMWQEALNALPQVNLSRLELKTAVEVGTEADLAGFSRESLIELLKVFHPWRKGPYRLFDIEIDTEWRSDWKWDRVLPHIQSLHGRRVLDVGGGNGYHGWRMLGEGAELVVGIDPTVVFAMQYQLMQHFIQSPRHFVLPIGIEQMPDNLAWFDTVLSMGVLYHRRSPLKHLMELRSCLRPKGELVLETLIIDGEQGMSLMPEGRYAKMKNVWFIPSAATMMLWMRKCGFRDVRCVDINVTSVEEQRRTEWMTFESLQDYLDPADITKTIEGYPAPKRGVFIATAP
ncbi:tRNA 5-methoxyuridine(34)/uridine 5-oxyacetic acid(34) synthase CmoB [Methylophaga sp. OBS4]|uniref:tRNA 5-methoxyuridine(34)/uridine 5-oxyacetic acid(34) synthase CmoB n=1 Tax=Methylophaga sp. OBS4 TaxID=2991935 RepID=UPI00225189D5|nr:tRNA 5-methoxyuridine(34)/uridine 5-oxyacetic acid(34) synthase CmoB [Methylophaga sp. OBS4]MCX4186266.1 tRNA 5-methoxyuridine(34)/uridine 5-oxyacetic acid(34) synthase CmoB [Methylophaga sp. OBS4]